MSDKINAATGSIVQRLILTDLNAGWGLVRKSGSSFYLTSTPHKPTRGRHRIVYERSLTCMVRDGLLPAERLAQLTEAK